MITIIVLENTTSDIQYTHYDNVLDLKTMLRTGTMILLMLSVLLWMMNQLTIYILYYY